MIKGKMIKLFQRKDYHEISSSTIFNQINSRQEIPIVNSYSSPAVKVQPIRQFQDQQPVITNQQYGQQTQSKSSILNFN
jgi:hypothetical protein